MILLPVHGLRTIITSLMLLFMCVKTVVVLHLARVFSYVY